MSPRRFTRADISPEQQAAVDAQLVVEVLGEAPGVKGNHKEFGRTWQGRPILRATDRDQAAEAMLVLALQAHPLRPASPLSGPLRLDVDAVREVPASWSGRKRARALSGELRPTTRPDRGNHLKLMEDALQAAGWIEDDSCVVEGDVRKVYGDPCGWRFTLGPVGGSVVHVD